MIRRGELDETMPRYLIDQLERIPNVEIRPHTEVVELLRERFPGSARCRGQRRRRARSRVGATALFVLIGADPCTDWLGNEVLLDDKRFVLTGGQLAVRLPGEARPLIVETSQPGLFAVGMSDQAPHSE